MHEEQDEGARLQRCPDAWRSCAVAGIALGILTSAMKVGILSRILSRGKSRALRYVALGDSMTYATNGFAAKYKDHLSIDCGVRVRLTNLGVPGLESSHLLRTLRTNRTYQDAVRDANIITVMIGFNDFAVGCTLYEQGRCGGTNNQDCLSTIAANLKTNLTDILSQIRSFNQHPNTTVLLSDLYDPWIGSHMLKGTMGILVPYLAQLNDAIHSVASSNGLGVAHVYQAFNGSSGSEDPIAKGYVLDGTHPNDAGHEVIAAQLKSLDLGVLKRLI